MPKDVDLDSRPIMRARITRIIHHPRMGSMGVIADVYSDTSTLLRQGVHLRTWDCIRADFTQPLSDELKHGLEYRLIWEK
jgi:hypothetical protein